MNRCKRRTLLFLSFIERARRVCDSSFVPAKHFYPVEPPIRGSKRLPAFFKYSIAALSFQSQGVAEFSEIRCMMASNTEISITVMLLVEACSLQIFCFCFLMEEPWFSFMGLFYDAFDTRFGPDPWAVWSILSKRTIYHNTNCLAHSQTTEL